MHTPDSEIPVKRLQLNHASGKLAEAPKKDLFLRGPIPLEWLSQAARLPGKTLNVALALWWLHGMSHGKPFKLTQKALDRLNVSRETAGDCLVRLEQHGLIQVIRKPGCSPVIAISAQRSATPLVES